MTYTYHALKHKSNYFVFAFGLVTVILLNIFPSRSLLITVFMLSMILLPVFFHFRLWINESSLTYKIYFLKIRIYSKTVSINQIEQIKFKRYGWATKGAVIQVHKGWNLRVIDFSPGEVYEKLLLFANTNNIKQSKSKDYQILEKLG